MQNRSLRQMNVDLQQARQHVSVGLQQSVHELCHSSDIVTRTGENERELERQANHSEGDEKEAVENGIAGGETPP